MRRETQARRRWSAAIVCLAALGAAAWGLAAGCRRGISSRPAGPLTAVQVQFRRGFDDSPAGIQLGPGWYLPEPVWGGGALERHGVAWTGQVAEVYFALPPFGDAEFVGLGLPLVHPGAPPQTVTATLNQHPLGTFPMENEWAELRIPLPAAALRSPVNALVLHFAHAEVPAAVGLGADVRALGGLFDTVGVVPRGAPLDGPWAPGGPPAGAPSDLPRRPLAGRPDVFVYLIDTLRADTVGVYGSPLGATPRIDAFGRDAMVFDGTRSASSWTLPAVFSILSGLSPFHHGVHVPGDRLPRERGPWLPTLLQRAGYETLGISQWLLGGDGYGVERGFDSFFLNVYQNGKMPSADARWFLGENLRHPRQPGKPLFAFLHTVDPHAVYEPRGADLSFAAAHPGRLAAELYNPQIFLARNIHDAADVAHLRGLYEGEVQAADREFGAFLDQLRAAGLYDESLVVLVADHGEEFDEHGAFDHGRTLFDELLRVPLLVKLPRSLGLAPRRLAAPASTLDLAPTLLDAIGRAPGAGFDGLSRLAELRGEARPAPERVFYSETRVDASAESKAADLRAVAIGYLKCIGDAAGQDQFGRPVPGVRAFDLRHDPAERTPLPPSSPEHRRCVAELARLAARVAAEAAATVHRDVSGEEAARLRALGYAH